MRGKYLEDRVRRTGVPSPLWYDSFGLYTPLADSCASRDGTLGGLGREDLENAAVRSEYNNVKK